MKKHLFALFFLLTLLASTIHAKAPRVDYPNRFDNPKKFVYEFLGGLRAPLDVTRMDISTGFTFKFGVGYQLTKNFELLHAGIDFGTSTPHDPLWVTVYDPYDYYPRLEQETVYVYGFPLTTRYRFQIKDQLELNFGGGAAYYWFQTKLTDPYWGELKKSRKRHGPGGLIEAGIFTDAFGEKVLAGLTMSCLYLKTAGKTLTTPKLEDDPDLRTTRDDIYFSFGISLRYYVGK